MSTHLSCSFWTNFVTFMPSHC